MGIAASSDPALIRHITSRGGRARPSADIRRCVEVVWQAGAVRYLGIDSAWGEGTVRKPASRSGVVALDAAGVITDAGWTVGLDEIRRRLGNPRGQPRLASDGDRLASSEAPAYDRRAKGGQSGSR